MTDRRYDLDWLRIAAFGLLILYHCGMFYVTWDWHVKSSRASDAIEPLMMLTNPWRLTLLFLVSGAATRFMADKMSAWKLTSSRMGRLWPPLLLAVFVIVPPQAYYEIVEALAGAAGRRSPPSTRSRSTISTSSTSPPPAIGATPTAASPRRPTTTCGSSPTSSSTRWR